MFEDRYSCISADDAVYRSLPLIRVVHEFAEYRRIAAVRNGNNCQALNSKCHPKMLNRIAMLIRSLERKREREEKKVCKNEKVIRGHFCFKSFSYNMCICYVDWCFNHDRKSTMSKVTYSTFSNRISTCHFDERTANTFHYAL